jgi:YD repeat-containing protein
MNPPAEPAPRLRQHRGVGPDTAQVDPGHRSTTSRILDSLQPIRRTIGLAVLGGAIAYLANLFLVVRVYDGAYGVPPSGAVVIGESAWMGRLTWLLLTTLVTALVGYLLNVGPRRFLGAIARLPAGIVDFLRSGPRTAIAGVLMSAGVTLALSAVLIPALALTLGASVLAVFWSSLGRAFATLIGRAASGIAGSLAPPDVARARGMTGAAMLGGAMALLVRGLVDPLPVRLLLAVLAVSVGVGLLRTWRPTSPATVVVFAVATTVLLTEVSPAWADDGGWTECGQSWSGLLHCADIGAWLLRLLESFGWGFAGGVAGSVISKDRDGDGKVDYWKFDMDDDGKADTWVLDRDGDGRGDTVAIDRDGDGRADHWAYDTDGDGRFDTVGIDRDGDGRADHWVHDSDGDGRWEKVPQVPDPHAKPAPPATDKTRPDPGRQDPEAGDEWRDEPGTKATRHPDGSTTVLRDTTGDGVANERQRYDPQGRLVEERRMNEDGTSTQVLDQTGDGDAEEKVVYGRDGRPVERHTTATNGETSHTEYRGDGSHTTTINRTDGSRDVIDHDNHSHTSTHYDPDGKFAHRDTTTYEADGSEERVVERHDGSRTVRTRTPEGDTEVVEHGPDGTPSSREHHTDDAGRSRTDFHEVEPDGTETATATDAEGNVIRRWTRTHGDDGSSETVSYAPDGRTIGVVSTSPDGSTITTTYDDQGRPISHTADHADGTSGHATVSHGHDGSTETVWYDSEGRPTVRYRTRPDGSTEVTRYDADGRPLYRRGTEPHRQTEVTDEDPDSGD